MRSGLIDKESQSVESGEGVVRSSWITRCASFFRQPVRRLMLGLSLAVFVCAAMALGFVKQFSEHFTEGASVIDRNERAARTKASDKLMSVEPAPQSGGQFDLSRNVIAGGGGTSNGGSFKLEGTVGQSVAGTTSVGGSYSGTGGFWQPASGVLPTPTPTPTPSPTPTPTPTPNPNAPSILIEEGTINLAVALDSVTFVRGPFKVLDDHNFSADHHRRVILFTSNLGLTQPNSSVLTVQAAGFDLLVENVGPVTGVVGLNASYIVVRLPDGLPSGDLPLTVTLNGNTSNIAILSVSP